MCLMKYILKALYDSNRGFNILGFRENYLFTRLENLAWFQTRFYHPSFRRILGYKKSCLCFTNIIYKVLFESDRIQLLGTYVSSRHSQKSVTLLKLMPELTLKKLKFLNTHFRTFFFKELQTVITPKPSELLT